MRYRRILHPTDFSSTSDRALGYAAELAQDNQSQLLILHAVEPAHSEDGGSQESAATTRTEVSPQPTWEHLLRIRPCRPLAPVEYILTIDDPVEAILRIAEKRACDLIVLGSYGRGGWRQTVLGHVAQQILRNASCSVLVVNAEMSAEITPAVERANTAVG